MTIRFTWGGTGEYTVFLCFEGVSLSPIYEPVVYGLKSCHAAQQIAQRGNAALKELAGGLLHPKAELPGVGFQYEPMPPFGPPKHVLEHLAKLPMHGDEVEP